MALVVNTVSNSIFAMLPPQLLLYFFSWAKIFETLDPTIGLPINIFVTDKNGLLS